MQIDTPEVVAEVTAAFERYEQALLANDVNTLTELFHDDPRTIRYGGAEILYGAKEIHAFRAARSPVGLTRTLSRTVIHGKRLCSWNTMLLTGRSALPFAPSPLRFTLIAPAVLSSSPATILSRVVFPQPEGPTMQKNSPARTSRSTSESASKVRP